MYKAIEISRPASCGKKALVGKGMVEGISGDIAMSKKKRDKRKQKPKPGPEPMCNLFHNCEKCTPNMQLFYLTKESKQNE